MTGRKIKMLLGVAACFIIYSAAVSVMYQYQAGEQYKFLDAFCERLKDERPDVEQNMLEILKEKDTLRGSENSGYLESFGYTPSDLKWNRGIFLKSAGAGLLTGGILFLCVFIYWKKNIFQRIRTLTENLEKMNHGDYAMFRKETEGEFSKLQDEIYKTVTSLRQTRDHAVRAKNQFADHLSNIAHQLKTPVTSISLSLQMLQRTNSSKYILQIKRQLNRLKHLEEALLLLARIDAGTLVLEKSKTDVFTLLMMAVDNLQELSLQYGVSIDVLKTEEADIPADPEWTMEAVMNLMKNCMEHSTKGRRVYCTYEKNLLYTQINIWDEGPGFPEEDIPYLFDRFFRGRNAQKDSTGIGLSIAKEIIEMQNGVVRAYNRPQGGACFELRIYQRE